LLNDFINPMQASFPTGRVASDKHYCSGASSLREETHKGRCGGMAVKKSGFSESQ
jgi:hypothetical protein